MKITRRNVIASGSIAASMMLAPSVLAKKRDIIEVSGAPGATAGILKFRDQEYPCMLGRSGILHPKFEGDGGTPAGFFSLREVRYRPDRLPAPKSGLPIYKTIESDGWCDDPEDPAYNRIVHMPYQTDAEVMWRDDHAYDVLAVIGYNDASPIPGAGSAIFLHVARPDPAGDGFLPTSGCISMQIEHVLTVLAECEPGTMIRISATQSAKPSVTKSR